MQRAKTASLNALINSMAGRFLSVFALLTLYQGCPPFSFSRTAMDDYDAGRQRQGRGGHGEPTFLEKSSGQLLEAACGAGLRGLGTAGFWGIAVLSAGVGVCGAHPALAYGLAFLEVRLGGDGVVDLFVG